MAALAEGRPRPGPNRLFLMLRATPVSAVALSLPGLNLIRPIHHCSCNPGAGGGELSRKPETDSLVPASAEKPDQGRYTFNGI